MRKYWFAGLSLFLLVLSACSVKDPVQMTDEAPVLSNLKFIAEMFLFQDINYPVSVRVDDSDGLDNIRLAKIKISNTSGVVVHEDTLADNGEEGDIIPRDGIYYTNLTLDNFNRRPGTYYFEVYAIDFDGNPALPLHDTLAVLAGSPPEILNITYTNSLDVALLQNAAFKMQVQDADGLDDIDSVYIEVQYPWADGPHLLFILNDQGFEGDSQAGDGEYTMQSDLTNVLTVPAEYLLTFVVVDKDGLKVKSSQKTLKVDRENHPPEILEVNAPNTATLPAEGDVTLVLECTVQDPQGLDDIDRVWFDSTKPDGTAASGNPFILYDNGLDGGDKTAGDGIYTLTIYLPSGTTTGTYTFDFQVKDHSGIEGNHISHELTVVE